MATLNESVNNQLYLPLSNIAEDLGCPQPKIEQWLKERDDITLRKTSNGDVGVDPLELRRCLSDLG